MKRSREYLSTQARAVGDELARQFRLDVYAHTRNRIVAVTDTDRTKFFQELEQLGYKRDRTIPGSSQGGYRKGEVEIIHKHRNHGIGRGKENEQVFLKNVQTFLGTRPVEVEIVDERNYTISFNADWATDSSTTGALEYSKADVDFSLSGDPVLGVSLKKEGNTRWDSGKTRFQELYQNFFEKALAGQIPELELKPREDARPGTYWMVSPEGRRYGRVVVEGMPKIYDQEMVFGKSSTPVVVAQKTFSSEDFCFNNTSLCIHVHKLYRNMEEVYEDGKHPVVAFGHHAGKENGIELRAFPASELPGEKSSTFYLPYNQII